MNILVIGSGGREHALIWALNHSNQAEKIFAAPGNGGISEIAECVKIDVADHKAVVQFCQINAIGLVVIGPEAPLVDGLADSLRTANIPTFGTSGAASQLEGSKEFTKKLCDKYHIPTAAYGSFSHAEEAKRYAATMNTPIVVKADGLAAGKGVIIAETLAEAEKAIDDMLVGNAFGEAGNLVVIEEFLDGEEISVFALSDGETVLPFGSAQDHKRVGEGDTGLNTGGMGTYSPAPLMTKELDQKIFERIVKPAIDGMKQDGIPYQGILFAGIMVVGGEPQLLEINVRFGDPETQCLMARLDSDLVELLLASANGTLAGKQVKLKDQAALCVVMAAIGYPGAYEKGSEIKGLKKASALPDTVIFHAGTAKDQAGNITATGGRVLGVTALGNTVSEAQAKTYNAVDAIDWPQGFCRRDIGWRAIEREKAA